jgi:tRNA threonylcarbamoyladenosine biosynthesis protein TsaB
VIWLLNIETAVQTASVCLSQDDKAVGVKINPSQSDHASWLQPAIASLLSENNLTLRDIDGFAVSAGPGSYTGLRVGMATVKGLCYALNKPLMLINTLQMMAVSALKESASLLCPMIDARRMEVFTAVFDHSLNTIIEPHNCILSANSFAELLSQHSIVFFGNGSDKFKGLAFHQNAIFKNLDATAEQMVSLSYQQFLNKNFDSLAYTEPLYGKDFFSPALKKVADI